MNMLLRLDDLLQKRRAEKIHKRCRCLRWPSRNERIGKRFVMNAEKHGDQNQRKEKQLSHCASQLTTKSANLPHVWLTRGSPNFHAHFGAFAPASADVL